MSSDAKHLGSSPMPLGGPPVRLERITDPRSPDIAALNSLLLATPSFRLQTQGRLPSANEGVSLFQSLPRGASRDDKFLWGAWSDGELVGCLEVVRHWPQHDCACIAFIVVVERLHRHGLGAQMVKLSRQRMHAWPGVRRLCLAVAENNGAALAFWRRAGFRDTGLREHPTDYTTPLAVLERPLT